MNKYAQTPANPANEPHTIERSTSMQMTLMNPRIMCTNHLIEEHKFLHDVEKALSNPEKVRQLVKEKKVDVGALCWRHQQIVGELYRRGTSLPCTINLPDSLPENFPYRNNILKQRPLRNVSRVQNTQNMLLACAECWERAAAEYPHANWI